MQDESRTSIKISQPRVAQPRTPQPQSSNRRMDFAPVHASSRVISPLPTDRDLERRRIAKQEMQRREAIRQQIEEQNRLKNLNQRRIEAARQELSEYQAVEEQRNRALEAERQRAIESQRVAQREALAQMAARRKAMEQEARRRQIEEKNCKLRAMQEMQRQKEASKINVSRRISVAPVQTSPFKENAETQSPVSPRSSSASLHSSISSLHPSAASHSSAPTPLRPAGVTKVLPASRIQVVASPNRKLFGRIRPAGPSRQVPQDEQDPLVQSARNSRIELPAPGASTASDSDLEDILYDAFEDSTSDTPGRLSAKSRNQNQNSESVQDTSENNMNYILGGRSPFINTDKIVKRPLSDSRKDDSKISTSFDTSSMLKNNEESLTPKARKNVYAKREHTKKATKKGTMIVEDRPKGVGISLAIAITFMIILGTVVGALVYFAFFQ
jgi:hypothetical protein